MRARQLIAPLVGLIVACVVAVSVHASPTPHAATPPSEPCRFENRMDLRIVEGVWFECSCEALMVGTVCDWYEITSPAEEPKAARKVKRSKPKARRLVPVLVVKRATA